MGKDNVKRKNVCKRRIGLVAIAGAAMSMGACSTTNVQKANNGMAPIKYKADQVGYKTTQNFSTPQLQAHTIPQTPPQIFNPAQKQPYNVPMPRPQTHTAPQQFASPAPTRELPPANPMPSTRPQAKSVGGMDVSGIDRTLHSHQRVGKTYTVLGQTYTPKHEPNYDETGVASWYGDKFHGKLTASGEVYDMNGVTAAHRTLPLNSMVYVTNAQTGKGMLVRVNDRGPFVDNRIIDLSREVARQLGLFTSGLGTVRVQYAGPAGITAERPASKAAQPKPAKPEQEAERVPEIGSANPFEAPGLLGDDAREAVPFDPNSEPPQIFDAPQDGPVTLTIKGPIHMASDKSEDNKAKFIPAIHKTQKQEEK